MFVYRWHPASHPEGFSPLSRLTSPKRPVRLRQTPARYRLAGSSGRVVAWPSNPRRGGGGPLLNQNLRRRFWAPVLKYIGLACVTPHSARHSFLSTSRPWHRGLPCRQACRPRQGRHEPPSLYANRQRRRGRGGGAGKAHTTFDQGRLKLRKPMTPARWARLRSKRLIIENTSIINAERKLKRP